jgi:hypothetical protein
MHILGASFREGSMATVSFQQGVNNYTSALDTMLQQASPAAAAGTATTIGVDTGTGVEVQTLLGFDNLFGPGPGQIPPNASITSATLTLRTTNGSAQGGSPTGPAPPPGARSAATVFRPTAARPWPALI